MDAYTLWVEEFLTILIELWPFWQIVIIWLFILWAAWIVARALKAQKEVYNKHILEIKNLVEHADNLKDILGYMYTINLYTTQLEKIKEELGSDNSVTAKKTLRESYDDNLKHLSEVIHNFHQWFHKKD